MVTPNEVTSLRTPQPKQPVLPSIAKRFSPRVFSADPIPEQDLDIMLEAARLAPSGRNNQPWMFYGVAKTSATYPRLLECIPDRNSWCHSAPFLIIAAYDPLEPSGIPNRWAQYDLGAAVLSLVLQATELGYAARQIGSFDWDKAKVTLPGIDPALELFVLIAVGKIGTEADYAEAEPDILDKETQPWVRKTTIYQGLP